MKKIYKQISLALVLLSIVSVLAISPLSALAVSTSQDNWGPTQTIDITGGGQNEFTGIADGTSIGIYSNEGASIQGRLRYVNTLRNKEFKLNITSSEDISLNMTCTEEEAELGLLKGNRVTSRNRHRYSYQEQFAVNISCNCTQVQARLRIRATEQNREGTWAYYNGSNGEWESVETQVRDGYLVADTDHFSTWTVLIPESQPTIDPLLIVGIVVGVVAVIGVIGAAGYIYKKR